MVVANQKSRHQQNPHPHQRLAAGSDDSLARSLHKDVDYPAVNVSRRSPDTPLGPDSRYPSPPGGQRKRQNTLLDTGWHTCFKNNNYVFVRNGSGTRPERQYGDKGKDTNNADITFVIATTDPDKQDRGEKLVVSLHDPVPKIKRCSPASSPDPRQTTPNGTATAEPDSKKERSGTKKTKKSDKKKSNWLKKLTPGRNKSKVDETAPICRSSPEDSSPEAGGGSPPKKVIKTIRISPSTVETPVKAIDLIGEGPHTSTPKFVQQSDNRHNDRVYKSLPRGSGGSTRPTPHRPYDGRYSVRRRLPYDETPPRREFQQANSSRMMRANKLDLDLSPLERRASCHRRIIESPKFQNRLHPTDSVTDIPYADSIDEEVSYEDSPRAAANQGKVDSVELAQEATALDERSADFSENVFFDHRPKNRGNPADFSQNVSFDERPKVKVSSTESSEDVPFEERPITKLSRGNSSRKVFLDERPKVKVSRGSSNESAEDVPFDERPKTKLSQGNSTDFSRKVFLDERPKVKVSRGSSTGSSEDVSFDENPKTKLSQGNSSRKVYLDERPKTKINRGTSVDFFEKLPDEEIRPKTKVSRGNSADFPEGLPFEERPKTTVSRGSQADLSDVSFDERPKTVSRGSQSDPFEDVSFDERPRRRVTRTKTLDGKQYDVSTYSGLPVRRRLTRANTMTMRPRQRCFSEPTSDERALSSLPEMRSLAEEEDVVVEEERSASEPSLRVKRSTSCRAIKEVASPMEEEENRSLDLHAQELKSPDDSTVTFSPYRSKRGPARDNPVSTWLKDLRLLTESECLNALQAKELVKEDWIANALAVGNAQEKAERIWEVGSAVGKHVTEMLETLKKPSLSSSPFSLKVAQFCSAVVDLLKMGNSAEQQIAQVEGRIKKSCSELLDALNRDEDVEGWKNKMVAELQAVQESIKTIVKQLLVKQLQVIVECVDVAANLNSLKRSVFALILLGRLHSTFCEIAVKLGGVRSLLAVVVETKWKEMHPCALRALTVLSCVPSAIRSFEESGGVDCVCDVLCEDATTEGARSEAAGLVAQITAPWTEGSGYVLQSIKQNAQRLVRSIANLASKTQSSEVFLLSSAALANLSFADDVLGKMRDSRVLEILVEACRSSPHAASLFIKDQVATVLANMASKDEYRTELTTGGGLVLLLCFLQLRPSLGHGAPQLAACERIQQKAAIALARLCTDPHTSNTVADMQGIQRLVKLCKDRKERNDSDSVLVACLAALRKIAAVRQKEEFKKLGAQELVEARLWDAFVAHSSKRESYV